MSLTSQPLAFSEIEGLSEKALTIHHDKLYAGYVTKTNEIREKLRSLETGGDVSSANQSYSELRALKDSETFATNSVYLHEWYFQTMGGNGEPRGTLVDALKQIHGSWENFVTYFTACGLAARGWVVLAWDTHDLALRTYTGDAHNQGGVWGCLPLLVLDVYEHAYFIDYGSDRKTYIENWWKTLDWNKIEKLYQNITT